MRREEQTRGLTISLTVPVGKSLFIPNDPDRVMLRVLGTGNITYRMGENGADEITTTVDFFNNAIEHPVVTSLIELIGDGSTYTIVTDCVCGINVLDNTAAFLTAAPGVMLTTEDPTEFLVAR